MDGNQELEDDDCNCEVLCQWLVSTQFCHLHSSMTEGSGVPRDGP
jgi:hypothetical protein